MYTTQPTETVSNQCTRSQLVVLCTLSLTQTNVHNTTKLVVLCTLFDSVSVGCVVYIGLTQTNVHIGLTQPTELCQTNVQHNIETESNQLVVHTTRSQLVVLCTQSQLVVKPMCTLV